MSQENCGSESDGGSPPIDRDAEALDVVTESSKGLIGRISCIGGAILAAVHASTLPAAEGAARRQQSNTSGRIFND